MKPIPQSIEPSIMTFNYSQYLTPQGAKYSYDLSHRKSCNVTIYSSAFVHHYLVGCTSYGMICIWAVDGDNREQTDATEIGNKRGFDEVHDGHKPLLCVPVATKGDANVTLYDVQFIQEKHLLIVSGDPGVLIYKWSDIQHYISQNGNPETLTVNIDPITSFQPHPSPSEIIEINSTSYDTNDGILYAASGDGFGCYQWDLESEQLLGTFGGGRNGHTDYLHVVKVVDSGVITGGEDGKMGFWNGKERKLIQIYDIQNTMESDKQLVTGQLSNKGFLSNSSVWNSGSSLWISSIQSQGDWLAVVGGAEHGHNGITARSSSLPATSGFMTMWHLPTRTFTSGCVTRESINTIAYNPALHLYVTGANEGRISYFESTSGKRIGRAWCSTPATYTISISSASGMMIAGGCGGVLDCFEDRVRVSQLRI